MGDDKSATWTDLTGFVADGPFHVGRRADGEIEAPSGRPFGMLKQTTVTVNGTLDSAAYFPMEITQPRMRVSYQIPANRWQALLHRIKQHRWLRWIPVTYVTYEFEAEPEWTYDPETGEYTCTFTDPGRVVRGEKTR